MFERTLAVLMWKHLMVRIRRSSHTSLEIMVPLVFFYSLYNARELLVGRSYITGPNSPSAEPLTAFFGPPFIFYYPQNTFTDNLMHEVGRKLNTNLNTIKIRGLRTVTEVENIKNPRKYALVVFENINEDGRSHFFYTIRIKNGYSFDVDFYSDNIPRPHNKYHEMELYKDFVLLQWTIDSSYIKIKTGAADITQSVSIQEFPYYNNFTRNAALAVSMVGPYFSVLSLFIVFVFQMNRLLEEKATGIQELIKMVGVSSNKLAISHFLNVLPIGIIYAFVCNLFLKTTSEAVLPHSDGFLMFLMFILHFISVVSMAFACSYVIRDTQYVTSASVFAYIVLWIPALFLDKVDLPRGVVLLSGIFPHVPMNWYWMEIRNFEFFGKDVGWSEGMKSHHERSGPVLLGLLWLALQSMLFFFLAWYLSRVAPGKYGIAHSWNFLCQRQYRRKNDLNSASVVDEVELVDRDEKYFELAPKHLEVGLKIDNVSKVFSEHKALSNVNLNVYKGEIVVLLGHNGAGKTTLMSIITGMLSPTEGRVFVNGEDITCNKESISKKIGFCPQHNIFFPDLTVLEHVMFFTFLKSGRQRSVRASSLELLSRLGLRDKAHSRAAKLSGGMKRRLQLAIALAGDADVLVLDEPTAGLDVETRRELWDLLLSLRGSRAVLLSTHFMEEADALGDRVAALHLGRVRCHATTMHLKKAIDAGYRLNLSTSSIPCDAAITSVVTSKVPEASLIQKSINTLTYNLPATTSNKFPTLFTALEEKKSQLEIESIGVGVTTLEEVFLKLCSDTDNRNIDDLIDGGLEEPTFNKVTGFKLYLRQFYVLVKRQFNFLMSKKIYFAVLQVLIPLIAIMAFTVISNNNGSKASDKNMRFATDLDIYQRMPEAKVMYKIQYKEIAEKLKNDYQNIEFVEVNDVSEALLTTCIRDVMEYNKYLVGIELNDTNAKVIYTTVVRQAAPVGMNLLTNILLTKLIGGDTTRHITTYNHPIANDEVELYTQTSLKPKDADMVICWAAFIVFIILATLSNLASLPCRERVSGSRHIHLLCGCPAVVHWAATLTAHALLAFFSLVLVTALAAALLDRDDTFNNTQFIVCMILVLTLGTFAYLSLMYFMSFIFTERGTVVLLIVGLITFGLCTSLSQFVLDKSDEYPVAKLIMEMCNWIAPPHALTLALVKAARVARLNALCTAHRRNCHFVEYLEEGYNGTACCAGEAPRCYYCWDEYSPGPEMLPLIVQFFFYMTLVILMQEGVIGRLWERVVNYRYKPLDVATTQDDVIKAESEFVKNLDKSQLEKSNVALLVENIQKNYVGINSCSAVKGISFSVKKGECFGLLGVNGAGKSTTFKMITAEECPTRGTIYANGYHLHKDRSKYMRTLGYCPQFFGLDTFQTGRANLELLMTLRGLEGNVVEREVKTWLEIVGLEKFGGRAVSGYSGGMCRRLGAAAALGCGGRAALLDEPTAGVDVAARRRVWAALRVRLAARPVLLSSHSMDEMEALCDRVAILAGGRVRALGSPHELRVRHATGHAVTLKLRNQPPPPNPARGASPADEVDGVNVNSLKNTLRKIFSCTLNDEHKTMLHYHINENMHYSILFEKLEALKAAYPTLIEDYAVTDTTLEEVFLSFAKEQQTVDNPCLRSENTV